MPTNSQKLPLSKKLLFAVVAAALFLAMLEVILAVAGVDPMLYSNDPMVGFSSRNPLFVEHPTRKGILITAEGKLRFFNRQVFTRKKQRGVTRVFCMGGSTTFGRPYDDRTSFCGWMRELLPAADPIKKWEVINAGGINYASYRVAALMEELAQYDPDIFVVYCGHNEFLERRTYKEIPKSPETVRGISTKFGRTRTYSGLIKLMRSDSPSRTTNASTFLLDGEVNAILDQSEGLNNYKRDDIWRTQVIAHYRYSVSRMIEIADACGAKIVFVTPASNLRHCWPFKSEYVEEIGESHQRQCETWAADVLDAITNGQYSIALEDINKVVAVDNRHAHHQFMLARVLDTSGEYDTARTVYQRALEEDVCALRAVQGTSKIIINVCAKNDVPVVDFAHQVDAKSPQGIPGKELFLDHVHLTIDGNRMLALAIISELQKRNLVRKSKSWNEATIKQITQKVHAGIDQSQHGNALRILSVNLAWAGKQEEAYDAAKQALEKIPNDAETHYQIASTAQRLGKQEEAVKHYEFLFQSDLVPDEAPYFVQALQFYGSILARQGNYSESESHLRKALQLNPDDDVARKTLVETLVAFGKELIRDGESERAVAKLNDAIAMSSKNADARYYRGIALIQLGRIEEARHELIAAIRLDPKHLEAHNNLGILYARLHNFKDAEHYFRTALEIDPSCQNARQNLQSLLGHPSNSE